MSGVQSVERAFAILNSMRHGATGVSEISVATKLPKSTVSRLLLTLADLGVVEPIAHSGGYRIGPVLHELGSLGGARRSLAEIARPFLIDLTRLTGEAAGLSVLAGNKVLYLDSVESDTDIQVRDWTGERVDPHVVSSGLVLLSSLTSEAVDAVCPDPLANPTAHSVVDRVALHRRLAEVKQAGHAWVFDEFVEGLTSVAAPIVDRRTGLASAAVHVHGPSFRFPGTRSVTLSEQVMTAAGRISAAMHRDAPRDAGRGVHP